MAEVIGRVVGNTEVAGLTRTGSSETSDNDFVSPTSHPNISIELTHKCMNLPPQVNAEGCGSIQVTPRSAQSQSADYNENPTMVKRAAEEATTKGKARHEGIGSCRM